MQLFLQKENQSMNTSEFEQRMKGLLEGKEYQPEDEAWNKMQQALQPPASRKLLLLVPVWKAAAAVAGLLVLAGGVGYVWRGNNQVIPEQTVVSSMTIPPAGDNTGAPVMAAQEQGPAMPNPAVTNTHYNKYPAVAAPQVLLPVTGTAPGSGPGPVIVPAGPDQAVIAVAPEAKAPHTAQPLPATPAQQTYRPDIYMPDPFAPSGQSDNRTLNLGVAANVGKPSLGNVQYNVGIVLHQDLGSRLFAEANVSLASTSINYSENVYGTTNSGLTSEGYMDQPEAVTMRYANNIIAVGFAPSIGVKATRNLSVSVGGDIYKSLNNGLLVQNKPALDKFAVAPEITDKATSAWDAGIRAQVDYKLGHRLSFNTQYRQGLTQFILVDKQSYKNSAFNVGIRYYIGR